MKLTPAQILIEIPQLKAVGWTASDIGRLVSYGLVKGDIIKGKNMTLVDVGSVKSVLNYRNKVLESSKVFV